MYKKVVVIVIALLLLCVSMTNYVFSGVAISEDINSASIVKNSLPNYKKEKLSAIEVENDFGIWIHTNYNGRIDEKKLNIDIETFKLMLDSGGFKQYYLTLENRDDTLVSLQFVRTKIFIEDGSQVDVLETHFIVETNCDTTKDLEISIETKFPFSVLNKKTRDRSTSFQQILKELIYGKNLKQFFKNIRQILLENFYHKKLVSTSGESYFSVRSGYHSPYGEEGPRRTELRFFFGRNKIIDPQVLRMKISPDKIGSGRLTYFNSYLTVDESGSENFYRVFSIDFNPSVELQITSIPREAKITYNFGHSAGSSTEVSLHAQGGAMDDIVQRFVIDPLPEYMSFDLTVLGERSFKYESDRKYSVTYMVDSIQNGNLVKLDLQDLPERMSVSWGLDVDFLAKSARGLIDLDMSSDIGAVKLYLHGSDKPFFSITNFPKKFLLEGHINVPSLSGFVSLCTDSDSTTTLSIPLAFDKWEILTILKIYDGYGKLSFDLPSQDSNHVTLGLDTDNTALFGLEAIVRDTSINKKVLSIDLEAFATENFVISFDRNNDKIENFKFRGLITKLIDLYLWIDYQGFNFDMRASWELGEGGKFYLKANKDIPINLDNLEFEGLKISGKIDLHKDSTISVEWNRGEQGYFLTRTSNADIETSAEFTFYDKDSNRLNIYAKIVINPNCLIKFDWKWGDTGHFTIFTNDFLRELEFKVGYMYNYEQNEHKYGFKIDAQSVSIVRTIQWDTVNGNVPRIWVLGDNPLPSDWDVWLLWNYKWYEVK